MDQTLIYLELDVPTTATPSPDIDLDEDHILSLNYDDIRHITALLYDDVTYDDLAAIPISTLELAVHAIKSTDAIPTDLAINAIKSTKTTPEEQALGYFTRRKLMLLFGKRSPC